MSIEGLPGEISVTLDLDLAPSVEEEDAAQGDSLIAHTGLTSSNGPPLHLHGHELLTKLEYRLALRASTTQSFDIMTVEEVAGTDTLLTIDSPSDHRQ